MSKSQHWYTRDGLAAHTQPNKSRGGERNTTLTDARKLTLVPSVSAVCRMLANDGLDAWKQRKLIEECFNRQPIGSESLAEYTSFISDKDEGRLARASSFGTQIHRAIEAGLAGDTAPGEEMATPPLEDRQMPAKAFSGPVLDLLWQRGVSAIKAERVAVSRRGYGGTVDLSGCWSGGNFIADFKTKTTKPGASIIRPFAYEMQIAAYWRAVFGEAPFRECANIFVSSTEPGRVEWMPLTPEALERGWRGFLACLELWKIQNNYDPAF